MIKLIFTSVILIGSLFFFQLSLVAPSEKTEVLVPITPKAVFDVQGIKMAPLQKGCSSPDYIEITVKVGEETKVIRQYYHCRT